MQPCPRCKQSRPDKAFEAPVTMCLICYGSIPGHLSMSLDELRAKARRARKGRRTMKRYDLMAQLEHLSPTCVKCKDEFPIEEFEEFGDYCRKCGAEVLADGNVV